MRANNTIRILVGVSLSLAVVVGSFYLAATIKGGISPVPSMIVIGALWMIIYRDKWGPSDRTGGSGGV